MIHEGEHKFKLSLTQAMPFTKDDIYHVIKTHPGISTREILGQLGYAASIGIDRQRLSTFLILVSNLGKKLEKEGKIMIIDHDDRKSYRAVSEAI